MKRRKLIIVTVITVVLKNKILSADKIISKENLSIKKIFCYSKRVHYIPTVNNSLYLQD